jgi:hypothetical protein
MKKTPILPTWLNLEAMLHRDDNEGFCLACGEEAFGIEPDAERYECEYCEKSAVYGAEQLLIMGAFQKDL